MSTTKRKKVNKKIFLIIGVVLIFIAFLGFQSHNVKNYIYKNQSEIKKQSQVFNNIKKYHSDFLKITFDVPDEYEIEEKYNDIIARDINTSEKIIISNINTNFDNLDEYLDYHIKINNQKLIEKQIVRVNNYEGIMGIIRSPVKDNLNFHIYYFYPVPGSGNIISFSTDSPELYSDLDQIAQSFRYEP